MTGAPVESPVTGAPAAFDARLLNWRFIVPPEPRGLMLLAAEAEELPGASVVPPSSLDAVLAGGPHPAIAIPDLSGWARSTDQKPATLLARLAAQVEPGGWLCAGFRNSRFPARPLSPGSLSLSHARRTLRRAGLEVVGSFSAFPSQRCPAYLVPTAGGAELGHFLRNLFVPFSGTSEGSGGARKRMLLTLSSRLTLGLPGQIRSEVVPAFLVTAARPR